jgi:hypothetical protein
LVALKAPEIRAWEGNHHRGHGGRTTIGGKVGHRRLLRTSWLLQVAQQQRTLAKVMGTSAGMTTENHASRMV